MSTAIILHGRPLKSEYFAKDYPAQSNSHWLPWLQKQLFLSGIYAQTPEIPLSYEPVWERWANEIECYDLNEDTHLVGHSCGGGFWLRYLSEHPELRVGKVVLVAPWIDVEQEDPNRFFDFELDENLVSRTDGLTIFYSDNDASEINCTVDVLQKKLQGARFVLCEGYKHFTESSMKSKVFPELLEALIE